MARPTISRAISFIEQHGALLVFPIKTNLEVPSLWQCFHPRTRMNWDWSSDASDKVPALWHLREELSRSREVIYAKWFQGRATFFSPDVFVAILNFTLSHPDPLDGLEDSARRLYSSLLDDSPQATKALKDSAGLPGKAFETEFQRGLRALWKRLLIVGYGEVEEGGFPSLAIGATKLLFEDEWDRAGNMSAAERAEILQRHFPRGSPFAKQLERNLKSLPVEAAPAPAML
jgi:hypothetical protein